MRLIECEVTLPAPVDVVFAHLTEGRLLTRWMAVEAVSDPRSGGELRWTHQNGATMVGRFVEVERPHRIVFTYGWLGDLMGLPPESSTVEITLADHGDTTTLRLVHRGVPPESRTDHRAGWEHFLAVLAGCVATPASTTKGPQ